MAERLPQARPPQVESRLSNRQNLFYPQARVVLSVYFENFGNPDQGHVFPVQARAITVYNNSYKEADTWSVEFDAQDLPVTPEMIRSGAVEIWIFQGRGIGPDNFPEVLRLNDDAATAQLEGLEPTIAGLFDDAEIELSNDGRVVSISGQDYTQLFISKQWDPKKSGNGRGRVPAGKPLDKVLEKLIREVDPTNTMRLSVEGDGIDTLPTVGKGEARTNKKGIPVKGSENYWDVMYSMAVRYGFILFVRGLKVVLTTPQAYVAGRSKVRKMLWGRNILNMTISRRMGKTVTPIVEVRSYDEKNREVIKARYPKNKKQKPINGIGVQREEVRVYNVPGIRSKDQLARTAETVFNLIARSEQTISLETKDLSDVEGTDLIEMRTGDALSIGFDSFNRDAILIEGQSLDQRITTLKSLGYDERVAKEIASGLDRVNVFRRPFRVKETTLDWSHDGGLTISAELQNFINIADLGDGKTKE